MPPFLPGIELSRRFYHEAVGPIIQRQLPGLLHVAALIGHGSEVLGYDTAQSTDHGWGPRLQLFVTDPADTKALHTVLADELPVSFLGYPTHFERGADGSWMATPLERGPVAHRVEVTSVADWAHGHLGLDPREGMSAIDWLCVPQQRLLTTVGGAVFHDGAGELTVLRDLLAWYPRDVWLYLLAAQWMRIAQHEPFVGRTGQVGDEVGSALVASQLLTDAMRLAFLLERRYWPYEKWFGAAFRELACAPELLPLVEGALRASAWPERERWLSPLYEVLAHMHNGLGLGDPLPEAVSRFHGRPFAVLHAERFAQQAHAAIADAAVRALPPYVGSIDQFVSSTDVLERPELWAQLRAVYGAGAGAEGR